MKEISFGETWIGSMTAVVLAFYYGPRAVP